MMFLMLPSAIMVPFQFAANVVLIWETMKACTLVGLILGSPALVRSVDWYVDHSGWGRC